MESLWHDVRHGLRALVRAPGSTVTVARTLAPGIGADAAVFSIASVLLLRLLPIPDADTLNLLTIVHQDDERPQVLQNRLFGVSSMDPATFVSVPLLLTGMAACALYVPAVRASQADRCSH